MPNPAKMRALIGPTLALTTIVGLAVAVGYATSAKHRLAPPAPMVHREPFDVPRLAENGRLGGRPATFEELRARVLTLYDQAAYNPDLPNLVALDPKRGFATAEEVLRKGRDQELGSPLRHWDSVLASLDDAWTLRARKEIYNLPPGSGYERKEGDPAAIPGQPEFSNGFGDFAMRLFEGNPGYDLKQYREVAPPLGAPRIIPSEPKDRWARAVFHWRTAADVERSFEAARKAGEAPTLARKAEQAHGYNRLRPDLLKAVGEIARRDPATFARTWIGLATNEEKPLGDRLKRPADLAILADLAPIAVPARIDELRTEALRSLREDADGHAIPAGADLLARLPNDAELRGALRDARWKRRHIVDLVAEGDKEALSFAAKWASDGNPVHECDGALLAPYPQADAITAPLHRSRSSRCRALLLDGYRRRSDPDATRRIQSLLEDPSPRVRHAARLILQARGIKPGAKRPSKG